MEGVSDGLWEGTEAESPGTQPPAYHEYERMFQVVRKCCNCVQGLGFLGFRVDWKCRACKQQHAVGLAAFNVILLRRSSSNNHSSRIARDISYGCWTKDRFSVSLCL